MRKSGLAWRSPRGAKRPGSQAVRQAMLAVAGLSTEVLVCHLSKQHRSRQGVDSSR